MTRHEGKRWAVAAAQALWAAAIAFTSAGLVEGAWIAWYVRDRAKPALDAAPDPLLSYTADAMFFAALLLAWCAGFWWLRRRYRELHGVAQSPHSSRERHRAPGTWYLQFAIWVGHVVLAAATGVGVSEWTARAYVRWYAFDQGLALSELSEDYGMAFHAASLQVVVLLIVALISLLQLRTTHWARYSHEEDPLNPEP